MSFHSVKLFCYIFHNVDAFCYQNYFNLCYIRVFFPVELDIINYISELQQSDTVYVSNNSDFNLEYDRYYQPLYNITWLHTAQSESPMAPVVSNINVSTNYTVVAFTSEQIMERSVDIQVMIVCKLLMFDVLVAVIILSRTITPQKI